MKIWKLKRNLFSFSWETGQGWETRNECELHHSGGHVLGGLKREGQKQRGQLSGCCNESMRDGP